MGEDGEIKKCFSASPAAVDELTKTDDERNQNGLSPADAADIRREGVIGC
jgi:hypothetical protein